MPDYSENPVSVRVMVTEDDSFTRKLLESMFSSMGVEVIFAINGEDGLEKFAQHSPDLVLSDYNMPVMNGLEMFEKIREMSPGTKLILMTIYTEPDVLIKAINMGVDRFIEKPVYKSKLEAVVGSLSEDVMAAKQLVRYQALLKSYRQGVDSSTIFSILDTDGCYAYVNSNFCSISEYSESELLGKHYDYIRKPLKASESLFIDNPTAGNGRIWQGCITNMSRNGREYITEVSLMPLLEEGNLSGYISIEKDMSLVVTNYMEQLNQFVNADSSVMFALDSSLQLRLCNTAFLQYFHFSGLKEAAEKPFCLFDYFEDRTEATEKCAPDCAADLLQRVRGGDLRKITLLKDGMESYFTVDIFMLDQSYLGLDNLTVVRLNDITELENLKKEELSSAMLASIGKLSAGITHEINTPLTYIKGNIELLQWEVEDSVPEGAFKEMEEYFTSINDGIDRIGLIIQSMREVTGEASFELENINLYSTFIVAGRMIYNRAKHISPIYLNGVPITLESVADKENMPYSGAPKMLEQLWIILLNNSLDQLAQCDFPFDKKYINITIKSQGESGYLVRIADNGGGFEPGMIGKLFDLFASTKKHKGMGIGLNIAKNIIDKHDGKVKPYNSNEGAVFEILL